MKNFLMIGAALMSMSAFSQSYMILNNGVTITTDKAGFAYDFTQFVAPYNVTLNGGQFFVENNKLVTIDQQGYLYRKDTVQKSAKGKGLNYVVGSDSVLVTVDTKGFVYRFDKEPAFKKAIAYGGNFLTVKDDKTKSIALYTINANGNYFKLDVPGLNPSEISQFGGNYFMTIAGVLYTVSTEGLVFAKTDKKVGTLVKKGGNFFVDSENLLYTVSDEGFLMVPVLPANLHVAEITKLGANYMVDASGKLFVVDKAGNIFERTLPDHDLTDAKILSL